MFLSPRPYSLPGRLSAETCTSREMHLHWACVLHTARFDGTHVQLRQEQRLCSRPAFPGLCLSAGVRSGRLDPLRGGLQLDHLVVLGVGGAFLGLPCTDVYAIRCIEDCAHEHEHNMNILYTDSVLTMNTLMTMDERLYYAQCYIINYSMM